MRNFYLTRLITQYERYIAGHNVDFESKDVIDALRQLLAIKVTLSEITDSIEILDIH